jgi:hypothetical protein
VQTELQRLVVTDIAWGLPKSPEQMALPVCLQADSAELKRSERWRQRVRAGKFKRLSRLMQVMVSRASLGQTSLTAGDVAVCRQWPDLPFQPLTVQMLGKLA